MSRRGSDGQALLDALAAVLVAALAAGAALPGIGAALRSSEKSLARVSEIQESRNRGERERMGGGEHGSGP